MNQNRTRLRPPVKSVQLFFFLLCSLVLYSGKLQAQSAQQRALAQTILSDKRLDTVYAKAVQLLAKGFAAGDGYPQVWIRDLNTFIETSCQVYDKAIIRESLVTFLRLQQPNGEIVDGYVRKGHVTWNDPNIYTSAIDTTHVGFKNTVETDQETSLIQAIAKYIRTTGDHSILSEPVDGKTVLQRLELAVEYLLKERYAPRYGLLKGATTQDWGDVQIEGGAVVDIDSNTHWCVDPYDNAMFVIALKDLQTFYPAGAVQQRWEKLEVATAANIRKYLWDDTHHKLIPHRYLAASPMPKGFDENKIFYHGATAIAIEAGLLSMAEIKSANTRMLDDVKQANAQSIGLTLYPPYPENTYPSSTVNKAYEYQNGGDWTWFGARMIQQLVRYGYVGEAWQELQPMLTRVLADDTFYEWYTPGGQRRGSAAFKGSAGTLAKAIALLRAWARQQS
ncbi:glucosidase family protein [Deminuibacter soli]|uniref:Uncharacterized protein n=1 Tax=Deminuibacter soli TaxID=2291815 RepID=A0A3E1NG01_9BACT|nr:hypothetical protein [Deminuibacter soli]RFM26890.1 hypothetical protein DXN05_18045 [Deminuibacter soli]